MEDQGTFTTIIAVLIFFGSTIGLSFYVSYKKKKRYDEYLSKIDQKNWREITYIKRQIKSHRKRLKKNGNNRNQ